MTKLIFSLFNKKKKKKDYIVIILKSFYQLKSNFLSHRRNQKSLKLIGIREIKISTSNETETFFEYPFMVIKYHLQKNVYDIIDNYVTRLSILPIDFILTS